MRRVITVAVAAVLMTRGGAPAAEDIVRQLAAVRPHPRQLAWQQCEFTCFVHFGINTFTGREWGSGKEDPKVFNPSDLDTDQWCRAMKAAGMKLVVFTAKHHDGFCLWQTRYTRHSVASSPWRGGRGDVLRDLSESCRRHGIKLGVYLSPADLYQIENPEGLYGNRSTYSMRPIPRPVEGRPFADRRTFRYRVDDYNEYFLNQLFELLTEYGPVHEVWFDGAHPKRKGGQTYTRNQWVELIRTLAPDAVIAVKGPDVRWCGNEAGRTRKAEWSVIPIEGTPEQWEWKDMTGRDLGSMGRVRQVLGKRGFLRWWPAETNTSIRHGWFWRNEQQGVKSVQHILDIWYRSVGGNTVFLLNIPPNRAGHFAARDVKVLEEVGATLARTFADNLASRAAAAASSARPGNEPRRALDHNTTTCWMPAEGDASPELVLTLDRARTFNRIMLQEQVRDHSQRIASLAIDVQRDGNWHQIAADTIVGYKRICRTPIVRTDKVRLRILEARLTPTVSTFGLYYELPRLEAPVIRRSREGVVTIATTPAGARVQYTTDGTDPSAVSGVYVDPFPMPRGGEVRARVVDGTRPGPVARARFSVCKAKWRVVDVSSEQADVEPRRFAIDENPDTLWHSRWRPDQPRHPHHITIDLGKVLRIRGFTYLPRKRVLAGTIDLYEFYVSSDGENWGDPASAGRFDNIKNNPVEQRIELDVPVRGRFIKLVGLRAADGKPFMSAAEVGVTQ